MKGKAKVNPIPAYTASERIDQMIADVGGWRGERLAEVRKLIHEADPEVVEEWKWKGSPVWSHEGMYLVGNAFKEKVKLTFFHGAQLADPKKLFNADLNGNRWRGIDIREADKLDKKALKALLREAVAFNKTHKVPKSKGSRESLLREAKPKAATEKPNLLSGGNPQIAKGDGDAPVLAYIAAMPGWKSDAGRRLDDLISRTVPGVRKAVKWNSPFYGIEGQGWFLAYHCFNRYIKVTFFFGTSLKPLPPVESKDPNTHYFHIHEGEQLDEKLVAGWIRQASKLPGWMA